MHKLRALTSTAVVVGLLAMAPAALAENGNPPPSNGSSDRGPTTYTPVYQGSNGASVGVITQPQPGTPQSAPSNGYGVGVQIPLPGGK